MEFCFCSVLLCLDFALFLLISPWAKWPPFRRRYFQLHFREWKYLYSKVCSYGPIREDPLPEIRRPRLGGGCVCGGGGGGGGGGGAGGGGGGGGGRSWRLCSIAIRLHHNSMITPIAGTYVVMLNHNNDVIMSMMASQITSITIVRSTVYSNKTPKVRLTGLFRGIHRWPMNSPHKGPVTREMFPFDDVIMDRGNHMQISCWKSLTFLFKVASTCH